MELKEGRMRDLFVERWAKRNVSRWEDLHPRRKRGWPIKRRAFGHYFSLSSSFKALQRRTKSWAGHVAVSSPFPDGSCGSDSRPAWLICDQFALIYNRCPRCRGAFAVLRPWKAGTPALTPPPADRKIHLDRREINRTPCKRRTAFLRSNAFVALFHPFRREYLPRWR